MPPDKPVDDQNKVPNLTRQKDKKTVFLPFLFTFLDP